MVALRLNDAQTDKAIARLKREKSAKDIRAADLAWCHYVVVFTTTPDERLSAAMVMELYRLRWLVELQIKRDKSIGGLEHLPNFREDTIEGWVSGTLLVLALARTMASTAFSPRAAALETTETARIAA